MDAQCTAEVKSPHFAHALCWAFTHNFAPVMKREKKRKRGPGKKMRSRPQHTTVEINQHAITSSKERKVDRGKKTSTQRRDRRTKSMLDVIIWMFSFWQNQSPCTFRRWINSHPFKVHVFFQESPIVSVVAGEFREDRATARCQHPLLRRGVAFALKCIHVVGSEGQER